MEDHHRGADKFESSQGKSSGSAADDPDRVWREANSPSYYSEGTIFIHGALSSQASYLPNFLPQNIVSELYFLIII